MSKKTKSLKIDIFEVARFSKTSKIKGRGGTNDATVLITSKMCRKDAS